VVLSAIDDDDDASEEGVIVSLRPSASSTRTSPGPIRGPCAAASRLRRILPSGLHAERT
jgi:hypothetical protein